LAVMVLLSIPQVVVNIRGVKLVAALSDFSVVWHIAGVCILALLLTFAGRYHNDWAFLLSTEHPAMTANQINTFAIGPFNVPSLIMKIPGMRALYGSGIYAFSFMLALLQAHWTYTGYDASAHMAEETYLARMNAAWGIFLSVAVSPGVGYLALLTLTHSIPPGKIDETVNNPYPVLFIVRNSLRPLFANAIAVIIAVAMWLCGLGSIASTARMAFAFARDRGFPGAPIVSRVSRWRTPANAIVVTSFIAVVVTFYSAAYTVVTSISTSALYLAYGIPIFLNWRNKRSGNGEYTTPSSAPWSLGSIGPAVNLISTVWIALITVLFSIPPNELAGLTLIALAAVLSCYWQFSQKRRFHGPRPATAQEIAEMEAAVGAAEVRPVGTALSR
jgi:amino acid transporter